MFWNTIQINVFWNLLLALKFTHDTFRSFRTTYRRWREEFDAKFRWRRLVFADKCKLIGQIVKGMLQVVEKFVYFNRKSKTLFVKITISVFIGIKSIKMVKSCNNWRGNNWIIDLVD